MTNNDPVIDPALLPLMSNDIPAPLAEMCTALLRFTGVQFLPLILEMLTAPHMKHWSQEPETAYRRLTGLLYPMIDSRPEPSNPEAEAAILGFLRHLRDYNHVLVTDKDFLGGGDGRQMRDFLGRVRDRIGVEDMIVILKRTPGLFTRNPMDGMMALAEAQLPSSLPIEARLRTRTERLSRGVELYWRPLLHGYLSLTHAYQSTRNQMVRDTVGALHRQCRDAWTTGAGPTALLDADLVVIRNANAHPDRLAIDISSETVTCSGRATTVGPLSDDDLRKKAETTLVRLFQASAAIEVVIFEDIFRRLDAQNWTLIPNQPLLPIVNSKPS